MRTALVPFGILVGIAFGTVAGFLAAPGPAADEKKEPAPVSKPPAEYFRAEVRGTLTVAVKLSRNPFDDKFPSDAEITTGGKPLALQFADEATRKKAAALNGKVVVVTGAMRFAELPEGAKVHYGRGLVAVIADPPPWPYLVVSGIAAADAK
jgi:hypothetical protein